MTGTAASVNGELTSLPWYPRAAVVSVEAATAAEGVAIVPPAGFSAQTLHLHWDSLRMWLPAGDVAEPDWLRGVLAEASSAAQAASAAEGRTPEVEVWGAWPDLGAMGDVAVRDSPIGWCLAFTTDDADWRVEVLPVDEDGHGRRLSDLPCPRLETASAGLQVDGRDLLLLFAGKRPTTPSVADALQDALADGRIEDAVELVAKAGEALGCFHAAADARLSTPPAERVWNARLKSIQQQTRSQTVWQAPHSPDTRGTLTHGNFGLEVVHVLEEGVWISGGLGGVYHALAPSDAPFPAVRDVAAGYISMLRICATLDAEAGPEVLEGQDPPPERPPREEGALQSRSRLHVTEHLPQLRRAFFEAWAAAAPPHCSSSRAMDTHRGGIAVWEYEQMLEWRHFHQALGRPEPAFVTRWLGRVSNIQAAMYRARTLSAGALICLAIPPAAALYWLFYPGAPTPPLTDVIAMGGLVACGVLLRRMYRAMAPDPW